MLEAAVLSDQNEGLPSLTYLRPRSQQAPSSEVDFQQSPSVQLENQQDKNKAKKHTTPFFSYIEAIKSLREISYDDKKPNNPLLNRNSTAIWFTFSTDYYFLDFFSTKKRVELKNDALEDLKKNISNVKIGNRFPRRRANRLIHQELNEVDPAQMVEKTEKLITFTHYSISSEWNRRRLKLEPLKVQVDEQPTTISQDQQFLSSTRALLFNLLKEDLKTKPPFTNVVQIYLESVKLTSPTQKVKRAPTVYFDSDSDFENEDQEEKQDSIEQELPPQLFQMPLDMDYILMYVIRNLEIQILIRLLENHIPSYTLPNPDYEPETETSLFSNYLDFTSLVSTTTKEEEEILSYFAKKEANRILKKQQSMTTKRKPVGDHECQICFRVDERRIACQMCRITAHPKCLKLPENAERDWICEVCLAFGPAGANLPCALCSRRSGIMRRTSTNCKSYKCQSFNANYAAFLKMYSEDTPKKERYNPDTAKRRGEEVERYNYFKNRDKIKAEPRCSYVWVHNSCLIFSNGRAIEDLTDYDDCEIEGLPNFAFGNKCQICLLSQGIAWSCRNVECGKFIHTECAARAHMMAISYRLNRPEYIIYCQQHRPSDLQQRRELRRYERRSQIHNFSKNIYDFMQQTAITWKLPSFGKRAKPKKAIQQPHNKFVDEFAGSQVVSQKNSTPSKKKDKIFHEESPIEPSPQRSRKDKDSINIFPASDKLKAKPNQQVLTGLGQSKKAKLSQKTVKKDQILSKDEGKVQTPEKKAKNRKNDKKEKKNSNQKEFKRATRTNTQVSREKEDRSMSAEGRSDKSKKKAKRQKVEQQPLYCICQQPYDESMSMLECEKCNEWYHFKCIGFIGSLQKAKDLKFFCLSCLKIESIKTCKKTISKYRGLFKKKSEMYVQFEEIFTDEVKQHSRKEEAYTEHRGNSHELEESRSRSRGKK